MSVQHRGQGGTLPATEKGLRAGRARLRATHAAPSLAGPVGCWGSACGPVARASWQGDLASANVSGAPRGKGRQCPAPGQLSLGDTRQCALRIYDSDGLMGWGMGGFLRDFHLLVLLQFLFSPIVWETSRTEFTFNINNLRKYLSPEIPRNRPAGRASSGYDSQSLGRCQRWFTQGDSGPSAHWGLTRGDNVCPKVGLLELRQPSGEPDGDSTVTGAGAHQLRRQEELPQIRLLTRPEHAALSLPPRLLSPAGGRGSGFTF